MLLHITRVCDVKMTYSRCLLLHKKCLSLAEGCPGFPPYRQLLCCLRGHRHSAQFCSGSVQAHCKSQPYDGKQSDTTLRPKHCVSSMFVPKSKPPSFEDIKLIQEFVHKSKRLLVLTGKYY